MPDALQKALARARKHLRLWESGVPVDAEFRPEDNVDVDSVELALAKKYGGPGPLPDPELERLKSQRYPLHSRKEKQRPSDAQPENQRKKVVDYYVNKKAEKDAKAAEHDKRAPGSKS